MTPKNAGPTYNITVSNNKFFASDMEKEHKIILYTLRAVLKGNKNSYVTVRYLKTIVNIFFMFIRLNNIIPPINQVGK